MNIKPLIDSKTAVFFATLMTIVSGVLAVYIFLTGNQSLIRDDDPKEIEMYRTPSLGIQFVQNNKLVEMKFADKDDLIVSVNLKKEPFQIKIPTINDGEYIEICATKDYAYSLSQKKGVEINGPGEKIGKYTFYDPEKASCFGSLDSAANTEFPLPMLVLASSKLKIHNTYDKTRVEKISDTEDGFFISQILDDNKQFFLTKWNNPLNLVFFIDKNKNGVLDLYEYQHVKLNFI